MAGPLTGLDLGNIQGNILGGFRKDYQTFLFFQIPDPDSGRAWLREATSNITTSARVLAFSEAFKPIKQRLRSQGRRDGDGPLTSTWVNVAFTYRGLEALGVSPADLAPFPDDFRGGMWKRAKDGKLGDEGDSAPETWIAPFREQDNLHGVLIVATDTAADCDAEVMRQRRRLTDRGLNCFKPQPGKARGDMPGHEHFGFKDGISQPGIRGFPDPSNTDPALIQPGEFVLGHATEPSDNALARGPDWANDGSYLVFRRLRQKVREFREFVNERAATIENMTPGLMGAKLVGRYQSGSPLERTGDQPLDPATFLEDDQINAFGYRGDPDGRIVPRAAHIRKTYPRDENPPGVDETRTHRLLRRGIPFGEPFDAGALAGTPQAGDDGRGLLFLCYQSSIENQFEYVQQQMANNPNFPQVGDGQDPIISQSRGTFRLPGRVPDHVDLMRRWVTTAGGEYFFAPSMIALRGLLSTRLPDHPMSGGELPGLMEQDQQRSTSMQQLPYAGATTDLAKAYARVVAWIWAHPDELQDLRDDPRGYLVGHGFDINRLVPDHRVEIVVMRNTPEVYHLIMPMVPEGVTAVAPPGVIPGAGAVATDLTLQILAEQLFPYNTE